MEATQGIKVLHIGDVFLDCPFSVMAAQDSTARRRETRETFLRTMRYIQEEDIRVLLVTGNLTDNTYITLDTLEFLRGAFSAIPNCRVFITPGNHDYIGEGSIYSLAKLPANVHVFDKETPTRITIEDMKLAVIGWAYCDKQYRASPMSEGKAEPYFDGVTLVAGYGVIDGYEGQSPLSIGGIGAFGGDYTALSGGSLFDGFHRVDKTTYAYSGALEHSTYEEPGYGGANLVTVIPGRLGGDAQVETARVDLGCRQYACETFDISGITVSSDVVSRVAAAVTEHGWKNDTALKLVFVGQVPVEFSLPPLTKDMFGLYALDVDNRTLPAMDSSRVARDMTVRGEVCRTFLPNLKNGTDEEKHLAAQALRVGIAALENRDFEHI